MAVKATQYNVGTTPVRIDTQVETDARAGSCVIVQNVAGSDSAYVGPLDVTDSTGFHIPAGTTLGEALELADDEAVYAVCASGDSAVVAVLETGI